MNLKKLLTFDLRSLALVRFFLGILCFIDIANRIPQLEAFYTDVGILPRWLLIQEFSLPWGMSLFHLNGSYSYALIVSIIGMIASLALAFGIRTRFSTIVVWIILLSFHLRFSEVLHGGDNLVRLMLFWSLFLPMNARYSVDAVLSGEPKNGTVYCGWGSSGWIIQTICVYLFTFLYKWDPVWFEKFDSVYYAMNLDLFTRPLGKALLDYPLLMKFSSAYAIALEGLAPVLILIPWRMQFWRAAAVLLLFSLHIGIWMTLVLGNFPAACLILWMAFIPPVFWDLFKKTETAGAGLKLYYDPDCGFCRKFCLLLKEFLFLPSLEVQAGDKDPQVLRIIEEKKSWVLKTSSQTFLRFSVFIELLKASGFFLFRKTGALLSRLPSLDVIYNRISRKRRWWGILINQVGHEAVVMEESFSRRTIAPLLALIVFAWNLEGFTNLRYFKITSPVDELVFTLQLNQEWAMFAPKPMLDDGWWVAKGTLRNGETWDILHNSFVDFQKKENVQDTYESAQWRKFFNNLYFNDKRTVKLWFGKYLCRRWNNSHTEGKILDNYTLYYVRERTPPPGQPLPSPETVTIWNHNCFD